MAMDLMSGSFLLPDGSRFGKNIIFGIDMSSSVYIDNKGKKNSTLTIKKEYSINFTEQ